MSSKYSIVAIGMETKFRGNWGMCGKHGSMIDSDLDKQDHSGNVMDGVNIQNPPF